MNIYEAVSAFYARYRGEKAIIGKSAENRSIFAFFVGEHTSPVALSQYAIHAREYVTALLALEHIRRGVTRGGAWVIPLVNPDGALLSEKGISALSLSRRVFLTDVNKGEDFSLWKANAEGVDLNVNFPARWSTGAGNVFHAAPQGYVGSAPLCAPESRALAEFTLKVKPDYTLSWHTKGEEIYWKFHQILFRARRDKRLAEILSKETDYPLKDTPLSAGGYKDWCIETLRIPAFTIEAGKNERTHPLGFEALPDLIDHNLDAILRLNEEF